MLQYVLIWIPRYFFCYDYYSLNNPFDLNSPSLNRTEFESWSCTECVFFELWNNYIFVFSTTELMLTWGSITTACRSSLNTREESTITMLGSTHTQVQDIHLLYNVRFPLWRPGMASYDLQLTVISPFYCFFSGTESVLWHDLRRIQEVLPLDGTSGTVQFGRKYCHYLGETFSGFDPVLWD